MTAALFEDPVEAARYADHQQAQIEEYGTWVAAMDITVGNGALAFAAGHPVPKSTVDAQGWDRAGMVVRAGTPAPEPGHDRAAQLRARQEALAREQAAIEAELADAVEPDNDGPSLDEVISAMEEQSLRPTTGADEDEE